MAQGKAAATTLQEVRAGLLRDGVVKLSSIKPAQARPALLTELERAGFEVTKSVVRRPLAEQLREALAHGTLIPLSAVGTHLRGATAAERKRAVDDAVKAGTARLVLRGVKQQVLCGGDVAVLSSRELEGLRARLTGLGRALEKVTKRGAGSLLRRDVLEVLDEARGALDVPPAMARKRSDPVMQALLQAVDSVRDARTGLSFVPAIVGKLSATYEPSELSKLLLRAAEQGLLELRPEGGIGRLSSAELSVCPVGPHGTRLSWARRLTGGAS